jgi:hypothetical protein
MGNRFFWCFALFRTLRKSFVFWVVRVATFRTGDRKRFMELTGNYGFTVTVTKN